MKTRTETFNLMGSDYSDIETLIEKLNKVRAMTNQPISVSVRGSFDFGYTIACSWDRPLTEQELRREEELKAEAERCDKEYRRKQYETLRKEFENE